MSDFVCRPAFARLRDDSPFFNLFELGAAPVLSPNAELQSLEQGSDEVAHLVFFVDLAALTAAQWQGILRVLSERSGTPEEEIGAEVLRVGLPLRMNQVTWVGWRDKLPVKADGRAA